MRTKTEMAAANANRTSTLPKLKLIAQGAITAICKFSRLLEIICKGTERERVMLMEPKLQGWEE